MPASDRPDITADALELGAAYGVGVGCALSTGMHAPACMQHAWARMAGMRAHAPACMQGRCPPSPALPHAYTHACTCSPPQPLLQDAGLAAPALHLAGDRLDPLPAANHEFEIHAPRARRPPVAEGCSGGGRRRPQRRQLCRRVGGSQRWRQRGLQRAAGAGR